MANIWITTGPIACNVVATSPITLSGLQTIDSLVLKDGDFVLAVGQGDPVADGPYIVRIGAWDRVISLAAGQQFYIIYGSANSTALYELSAPLPITVGYTALTFIKVSGGSAQAGSFTTVTASGAITGASLAVTGAISGTTVTGTGTGTFPNVTLTSSGTTVAGQTNICQALYVDDGITAAGLGVINGYGGDFGILSSGTSATASSTMDVLPFSLTNNATRDYNPESGGTMLVVAPTSTISPMAHIGFAGNGVTTLNGVTPAGGISLTLGNATTLNINASGGKVRFENKTGVTINVLAVIFKFKTA